MAPPKVFVSHSNKDNDFTFRLVDDLRAAGAVVWLDKTNLGAGDYQRDINDALKEYEWFALMLTQDAIESPSVYEEVNAANRLRKLGLIRNLIFIKAGQVEQRDIPALWGTINVFDGVTDYMDALNRTLNEIGLSPVVISPLSQPSPSHMSQLDLTVQLLHQHAEVSGRPNLSPVGAIAGRMESGGRLIPDTEYTIVLKNYSDRLAWKIDAVLFPSSTYIESGSLPQRRYDLRGTYWQGSVDTIPPTTGIQCEIRLREARAPLKGDDRVTPQHALYAPEQPPLGASLRGVGHFYSARLTITFRDNTGTRLATIFDLSADQLAKNLDPVWQPIAWPIEIGYDLLELTDKVALERKPPVLGG